MRRLRKAAPALAPVTTTMNTATAAIIPTITTGTDWW
jgi:hypothetical protein